VPGLVEEWSVDETNTTWTLKLREGVTFHDGTPFNAEALKFNFDRIINPETASRKAAGLLLNPTTTVVDEYTVEVKYDAPYGAFLDALSTPVLGIVSPASVEQYGADVGRNPVGTGPFKFVEWIAQDRIVLERNPDYNWAPPHMQHQGPVGFDQLIFRIIPEDVARVVALETGEIDALINLPREQVARFENDPAFGVEIAVVAGSPAMMILNGAKFPTDDPMVRQALQVAVNQDDLISAALFGVGQRAYSPISNANPCYDSSLESQYAYNPDQARTLLADAGLLSAALPIGAQRKSFRRNFVRSVSI
jgi:peptide/nickel transport system substrate-binding protein